VAAPARQPALLSAGLDLVHSTAEITLNEVLVESDVHLSARQQPRSQAVSRSSRNCGCKAGLWALWGVQMDKKNRPFRKAVKLPRRYRRLSSWDRPAIGVALLVALVDRCGL